MQQTMTSIPTLTARLSASLRRPGRTTLLLLDKALAWLRPFESPAARTATAAERRELLELVGTHREILSPYIDTDLIETNLQKHT